MRGRPDIAGEDIGKRDDVTVADRSPACSAVAGVVRAWAVASDDLQRGR
jgi:hypothetical protein